MERLATPKTSEEHDVIQNLKGNSVSVWLGLSDLGSEGNWYYSDGSYAGAAYDRKSHGDWTFEKWLGNQPDDSGGSENCVEMRNGGEWNDMKCTDNVRATYAKSAMEGLTCEKQNPSRWPPEMCVILNLFSTTTCRALHH